MNIYTLIYYINSKIQLNLNIYRINRVYIQKNVYLCGKSK